jgi:hypothetical protein
MLGLYVALATLGPLYVAGHGNMVWPPSWFDPLGEVGLDPGGLTNYDGFGDSSPIMWFSNWTFIPGESTLDPAFYTVPDFHGDAATIWHLTNCLLIDGLGFTYDVCFAWYPVNPAHNPWMAPGSAPTFSPCGIEGGNPFGCNNEEYCPGGGFSNGRDARDVPWGEAGHTVWKRGTRAVVGWGILANHGGGYSYRLCKVGKGGPGAVTEECFQKTPLRFASENSWVQYGWDEDTRVVFKANRTMEGTSPPGSEWTMNPIPVCNSTAMGWMDPSCPNGFEFPPRGPGLFGTGENIETPGESDFLWTLMDEVEVPLDLETGDYVLSFRWDCEATPQIWNACSNIVII